jgi:hypothetical protein
VALLEWLYKRNKTVIQLILDLFTQYIYIYVQYIYICTCMCILTNVVQSTVQYWLIDWIIDQIHSNKATPLILPDPLQQSHPSYLARFQTHWDCKKKLLYLSPLMEGHHIFILTNVVQSTVQYWLIDWIIDWLSVVLTSSERDFSYINDENKQYLIN